MVLQMAYKPTCPTGKTVNVLFSLCHTSSNACSLPPTARREGGSLNTAGKEVTGMLKVGLIRC